MLFEVNIASFQKEILHRTCTQQRPCKHTHSAVDLNNKITDHYCKKKLLRFFHLISVPIKLKYKELPYRERRALLKWYLYTFKKKGLHAWIFQLFVSSAERGTTLEKSLSSTSKAAKWIGLRKGCQWDACMRVPPK